MSDIAKQCESDVHVILPISKEMFSDQVTITRIAFLLCFTKKLMDEYPEKKYTKIYFMDCIQVESLKQKMDTLTICRLACTDCQIRKTFAGVFSSDSLPKCIKHYSLFIVNLNPRTLLGS